MNKVYLVNKVFETHDELLTATLAEAHEIAGNSQITVRGIKHVLDVGRDMPIDQALNYVYTYNTAYLHSKDFVAVMEQRAQKAARKASA